MRNKKTGKPNWHDKKNRIPNWHVKHCFFFFHRDPSLHCLPEMLQSPAKGFGRLRELTRRYSEFQLIQILVTAKNMFLCTES